MERNVGNSESFGIEKHADQQNLGKPPHVKNEQQGFISDSLLLGVPNQFNTGSTAASGTSVEKIPSISSLSSQRLYLNQGNMLNTGVDDSYGVKGYGEGIEYGLRPQNYSIGFSALGQHHTLGQLAEQIQEKARADKAKLGDNDMAEDFDAVDEDEDGNQTSHGTESTGRWTRQEHELFLEALKKYGKEWKKVASMVKTRTVVQTRTHAQKYFQKLHKTQSGGGGGSGSLFTDYPGVDNASATSSMDVLIKSAEKKASSSKKARKVSSLSPFPSEGGGRYPSPMDSSMMYYGSTPVTSHQQLPSAMYSEVYNSAMASDYRPGGMLGPGSGIKSMGGAALGLHVSPEGRSNIPLPPSSDHFPQPSPAACGKRKHAELKAAQMLAATATIDMEGAQVLSMLKDSMGRKRPSGLSLTISNPDNMGLGSSSNDNDNTPGTPWDSQMRALEARNRNNSWGSASGSNSFMPVSTPSEQKNFLSKVRTFIQQGDVEGLTEVLNAAEYSAQTYLDASSAGSNYGALAPTVSVSTLMTVYAPGALADADASPEDEEMRANTKTNGSTLIRKATVASMSLVARSLNRTDRKENRTVLMETILSTSFDQMVLYNICLLLLDHGASTTATDAKGNTCLHMAAANGYQHIGQLLLTKGCPVNAQNAYGDAATHVAAKKGHGPFLEMLADLGANFHLRNSHALCALDLAGYESKDPGERAVLRRIMLQIEPRLRTLILFHEDCLEHSARRPSDWEGPDRVVSILKRLRDRKEFPEFELELSDQFEKADVTLLGRVHSPEYLGFVNNLSKQVKEQQKSDKSAPPAPLPFTPQVQRFVMNQTSEELKKSEACDTSFSVGTLNAARRAAGAVAHAVDRVMLGRNRNVFCVVRPPGHHAGCRGLLDGGYSCGFCIFNNVAAGAMHALETHNCERVAVVDLDIHHGNGTEDIIRKYPHPSRLFFFSVHLYDKEFDEAQKKVSYQFYPGSGASDDTVHNIINVALSPLWKDGKGKDGDGAESILRGRQGYRQAILQRLLPSLRAFNPDFILLSSGFDAAAGDLGNVRNGPGSTTALHGMDLTPDDFSWVTTEICKIADLCCGGRLVSVLEGGYGEYKPLSEINKRNNNHRAATRNSSKSSSESTSPVEQSILEGNLDRDILCASAVAHVHRLIDPYGPSRIQRTIVDSESEKEQV